MRYSTGSRSWRLVASMSIFARSTREPGANSPWRMRSNRSRFSAGERSRNGLGRPGWVREPRPARISSNVWSSTYASHADEK